MTLKLTALSTAAKIKSFYTRLAAMKAVTALSPGLYPVRGMLYFLYHPTLFRSCLDRMLRLFLITLGALLVLSLLTYKLQYFFLAKLFGPGFLGHSATLAALLAESIIPVYLLSERFIRAVGNRLFDTVLKQQGIRQPLSSTKQQKAALQIAADQEQQYQAQKHQEWGILWKVFSYAASIILQPKATESTLKQYLRMASTTPVFALAPIGPIVFAYLNGFGSTAKLLDHYLVQKDLKRPSDRESWYQLHQREFRMFGAVVFALNLIPVANWLFVFTNTVGAALYAADIERNGTFIKGKSQEEVSSLAALTSTISQVQSLGSSPMTRSQKAAHRINVSHQ